MKDRLVIGLDYGSDSVRAVLVDCKNGEELASAVCAYRRWSEGQFCNPMLNQYRQHPLDYLEGLTKVVKEILAVSGTAGNVVGIGVDTTGSTPVAVDEAGTALALKPEFADNPNAMFILWKDHTAVGEAEEINRCAKNSVVDYTRYEGGVYSSEWFWAKILHTLREDESVRRAAFSWVEHCDWLPAVLTGNTNPYRMKRSSCAAGHKAMWHESWGGLPPEDFFSGIDPLLCGLRDRLYTESCTSDEVAGYLSEEWAAELGLPVGIPVAIGAFDCHMGAVGAKVQPGVLTKVIGTSTCDITVANVGELDSRQVRGICGQVDGSVLPGLIGLEAGQSAFGDLYAWFKKMILAPSVKLINSSDLLDDEQKCELVNELQSSMLIELDRQALQLKPGESGITALDWINGRRTPDADQRLKTAVSGLSMGSGAAEIYRALVEATAFGSRRIVERFEEEGVAIEKVVAIGGIANKSPLVMQILADVLKCSVEVVKSTQCCALGAAVFAARVADVFPSMESACDAMSSGILKTYTPNPAHGEVYDSLYEKYRKLGVYAEGGEA